jgi:hypothetical protein
MSIDPVNPARIGLNLLVHRDALRTNGASRARWPASITTLSGHF